MSRKIVKILGVFSALAGVFMLIYVVWPLLSYELLAPRYATYLSPVPSSALSSIDTSIASIDYTDPSSWFEGVSPIKADTTDISKVRYYTVSIPKLNISGATVAIGGEDLSDSLIQYPGTAYPGKRGNSVIFGHSILPQFFNPKNYLSIFSTINTLKKGDEIIANYDGITYNYRVEDMFEVAPTDIQILEQNPSSSFLSLVTCTPPGHPLRPRRLVVRARITPYNTASTNEHNWN